MKESRVYRMELDFYQFAKNHFDFMKRRIFDVKDGYLQVRRQQFMFEKIRPSEFMSTNPSPLHSVPSLMSVTLNHAQLCFFRRDMTSHNNNSNSDHHLAVVSSHYTRLRKRKLTSIAISYAVTNDARLCIATQQSAVTSHVTVAGDGEVL